MNFWPLLSAESKRRMLDVLGVLGVLSLLTHRER